MRLNSAVIAPPFLSLCAYQMIWGQLTEVILVPRDGDDSDFQHTLAGPVPVRSVKRQIDKSKSEARAGPIGANWPTAFSGVDRTAPIPWG